MNYEQMLNMSIQDSQNNNVDENSNDHEHTNHQFERYRTHNENNLQPNIVQEQYEDMGINRLPRLPIPNREDSTDSVNPHRNRYLNSLHRRNRSEGLPSNSASFPPLPRGPHTNLNGSFYHNTRVRISEDDICKDGEGLLYMLAEEEFKKQGFNFNEYLPPEAKPWDNNPDLKNIGRDLRKLADEFARSPEREDVKRRAQGVNMSSITCENFFELCTELFRRGEGGITRERVVVLFVFIVDVAIQQVKQHAERFISQLMTWSIRYIFDHVCAMVQEAGGWAAVLSRGIDFVYKCTIFTVTLLAGVAFGLYIKNNWNRL